jgi:hypothetical protein
LILWGFWIIGQSSIIKKFVLSTDFLVIKSGRRISLYRHREERETIQNTLRSWFWVKKKVAAVVVAGSMALGGLGFAYHNWLISQLKPTVNQGKQGLNSAYDAAVQRETAEFQEWLKDQLGKSKGNLEAHGASEAEKLDAYIDSLSDKKKEEVGAELGKAEDAGKGEITTHREGLQERADKEADEKLGHPQE